MLEQLLRRDQLAVKLTQLAKPWWDKLALKLPLPQLALNLPLLQLAAVWSQQVYWHAKCSKKDKAPTFIPLTLNLVFLLYDVLIFKSIVLSFKQCFAEQRLMDNFGLSFMALRQTEKLQATSSPLPQARRLSLQEWLV